MKKVILALTLTLTSTWAMASTCEDINFNGKYRMTELSDSGSKSIGTLTVVRSTLDDRIYEISTSKELFGTRYIGMLSQIGDDMCHLEIIDPEGAEDDLHFMIENRDSKGTLSLVESESLIYVLKRSK